ncbi:MAG: SIS domain-containing protein [Erysipelotrichaceae bacterium]|nr:SIS domain-containing protein [Erysipelotrichaceae bacterium]
MNYHSYQEIRYGYQSLKQTFDSIIKNKEWLYAIFLDRNDIVFLGCGASYWASVSGAAILQKKLGKKITLLKAADVVMSEDNYKFLYDSPLFIVPSRSGQSKETLQATDILKNAYPDHRVLSITMFENNPLMKLSDVSIFLPWSEEISVCSTRSFNNVVVTMLLIAMILKGEDPGEFDKFFAMAETIYAKLDACAREIVNKMENPQIATLGAGVQYGAVIAGAYILVEMAQWPSSFYQTLEYRHGPIVTAKKSSWIFISSLNETNVDLENGLIREILTQGGQVVLFGRDRDLDGTINVKVEQFSEELRGSLFTTLMQMIAYHFSLKLGLNPDKPGDLNRFITY